MISKLRQWAYQRQLLKTVELPAYVVSVGNISLGGTGKSAFVMLLAEWAVAQRLPTAVLTRGYKRRTRGMRLLGPFAPLPNENEIGDEPWMIKRRVPGVSLLVHADRARMAARHWQELGEPKLVVLDDAFQHWRCARDADILMIDATESLDQPTLPFGRLRETVLAARRADLLVITRANAVSAEALAKLEKRFREASLPRVQPHWKRGTTPGLRILAADYACSGFRDAVTGEATAPNANRDYLLVSGIAKPDHLRRIVKEAGLGVKEELYFPDHHRLSEGDMHQIRESLSRLRNGCLLVTEKDWGRWRDLFGRETPGLVIAVEYEFLGNGKAELDAFLAGVALGAR